MSALMGLLKFLRLVDRDGHLSLTSIALMVCVAKLALVKNASFVDIGALLMTLAAYGHKRVVNAKLTSEQLQADKAQADGNAAVATAALAHDVATSVQASLQKLTDKVQAIDNRTAGVRR